MHLHGMVKLAKGFFLKKLKLSGFNIKLKQITSLIGWIQYCSKDPQARDDLKLSLMSQDLDEYANAIH